MCSLFIVERHKFQLSIALRISRAPNFFCTVIGHSEDILYLKWFGYRIHIKFITKTFLSFDLERHKQFANFKHILYQYCRSFHYFASIFSFLVASILQYLKDS